MPLHNWAKNKESSSINPEKFKTKDVLSRILNRVKAMDKMVSELKGDFSQLSQTIVSHSAFIKQLETLFGQFPTQINARPRGGIASDIIAANPKNDTQVLEMITRSGKTLEDHFK